MPTTSESLPDRSISLEKHSSIHLPDSVDSDQLLHTVNTLQIELKKHQDEMAVQLELLIHAGMVKEKIVGWISLLSPYLNTEGKVKLHSIIKHVQRELNDDTRLEFEKKFDYANANLYKSLDESFPNITKNEKRLCAFMRLNHSASDIAKMTNKSLNSINVALARLRTKLGLPDNKAIKMLCLNS